MRRTHGSFYFSLQCIFLFIKKKIYYIKQLSAKSKRKTIVQTAHLRISTRDGGLNMQSRKHFYCLFEDET